MELCFPAARATFQPSPWTFPASYLQMICNNGIETISVFRSVNQLQVMLVLLLGLRVKKHAECFILGPSNPPIHAGLSLHPVTSSPICHLSSRKIRNDRAVGACYQSHTMFNLQQSHPAALINSSGFQQLHICILYRTALNIYTSSQISSHVSNKDLDTICSS